jgi:hypothetical protein
MVYSEKTGKKGNRILVVCHDAGAAEIISAHVKSKLRGCDVCCYVSGPAISVFERKKIEFEPIAADTCVNRIFDDLSCVNELIAGTSWQNDLDSRFVNEAKRRNIKTIVYLDHWVDYKERFGYPSKEWTSNLPDEIWVGDELAKKIAEEKFRKSKVILRLEPNLYFEEVRSEFKKKILVPEGKENILFISEPLANEHNILKSLVSFLVRKKFAKKLIIRFHPSDKKDKYNDIRKKYDKKIEMVFSDEADITEDFARTGAVIGINSMALVLAALCGKRTLSYSGGRDVEPVFSFYRITRINNMEGLNKLFTFFEFGVV